jgi:hypothetical protein
VACYELSTGTPNPVNPVLQAYPGNCPAGTEGLWEGEAAEFRFAERFGRGADPHRCMVSGGTLG